MQVQQSSRLWALPRVTCGGVSLGEIHDQCRLGPLARLYGVEVRLPAAFLTVSAEESINNPKEDALLNSTHFIIQVIRCRQTRLSRRSGPLIA